MRWLQHLMAILWCVLLSPDPHLFSLLVCLVSTIKSTPVYRVQLTCQRREIWIGKEGRMIPDHSPLIRPWRVNIRVTSYVVDISRYKFVYFVYQLYSVRNILITFQWAYGTYIPWRNIQSQFPVTLHMGKKILVCLSHVTKPAWVHIHRCAIVCDMLNSL